MRGFFARSDAEISICLPPPCFVFCRRSARTSQYFFLASSPHSPTPPIPVANVKGSNPAAFSSADLHVCFLRQQLGAAGFYVGVVQFMASDVIQRPAC